MVLGPRAGGVADTAGSAPGHDDLIAGLKNLPDEIVGFAIEHKRPEGNLDHAVEPLRPALSLGGAVPAGSGAKMSLGLEIEEGRQLRIGSNKDMSAPSPVPAVRERIAGPEITIVGAASLPAVTGLHPDGGPVDEAGHAA